MNHQQKKLHLNKKANKTKKSLTINLESMQEVRIDLVVIAVVVVVFVFVTYIIVIVANKKGIQFDNCKWW